MKPKGTRRRWLQYGLRSLLVLTLAVAVFLGWWTQFRRPYVKQQAAIDGLVKHGAKVETKPKGPAWLAWLLGDSYVEVASIRFQQMDIERGNGLFSSPRSADLACLGDILALRHLDVSACPALDDKVCETICKIDRIESLDLGGTRITHDGLSQLQRIAGLCELSLRGCESMDDRAFEVLTNFPELEILHIELTESIDAGLSALTRISKLKKLHAVGWSKFSPRAAKILSACPHLETLEIDYYDPLSPIEFRNYPALKTLSIGPGLPVAIDRVGRGSFVTHAARPLDNLIVQDMPKLERLDADRSMSRATTLRRLPELRVVRLTGLSEKTVLEELPAITDFSNSSRSGRRHPIWTQRIGFLKRLSVCGMQFMNFPELTSLEQVELTDCEFAHCPSGPFPWLKSLEVVRCAGAGHAPDELARALLRAPNLEQLKLDSVLMREDDVASLAEMAKLTSLRLSGLSGLSVNSLRHLANLPNLRELELSNLVWDDAALPYLNDIPKSVAINLHDISISLGGKEQVYTGRAQWPVNSRRLTWDTIEPR